jgi:hypothetical protein
MLLLSFHVFMYHRNRLGSDSCRINIIFATVSSTFWLRTIELASFYTSVFQPFLLTVPFGLKKFGGTLTRKIMTICIAP